MPRMRDHSPLIAVSCDVADADAMTATIGSPTLELAAVMEKHGVLPRMIVYVEG